MYDFVYLPHAQNVHVYPSASSPLEITRSEHGYERLCYETEVYAHNVL